MGGESSNQVSRLSREMINSLNVMKISTWSLHMVHFCESMVYITDPPWNKSISYTWSRHYKKLNSLLKKFNILFKKFSDI